MALNGYFRNLISGNWFSPPPRYRITEQEYGDGHKEYLVSTLHNYGDFEAWKVVGNKPTLEKAEELVQELINKSVVKETVVGER